MKRKTLAAVLVLTGFAVTTGTTWAADDVNQSLQGITVHHRPLPYATTNRPLGDCTPPSVEPNLPICRQVAVDLNRNFTHAQIQMLFGAWTPHPEYRTSYDFLTDRYTYFLRDYEIGNHYPVAVAATH